MMRKVDKEEWIASLQWGDIGLVRGKTLFGFFQNLQRKQDKIKAKATHGLIVKDAPTISEADGTRVWADKKIDRYFSNHHKIWVFRPCEKITKTQRAIGEGYLAGAEQASYGWEGIGEITRRFFRKLFKKEYVVKDRVGLFCTEHTSRFALAIGLPWTDVKPEAVTPSLLLDWMFNEAVPFKSWELVAYYEEGDFYL
jgi:hypothetical protein